MGCRSRPVVPSSAPSGTCQKCKFSGPPPAWHWNHRPWGGPSSVHFNKQALRGFWCSGLRTSGIAFACLSLSRGSVPSSYSLGIALGFQTCSWETAWGLCQAVGAHQVSVSIFLPPFPAEMWDYRDEREKHILLSTAFQGES